MTSILIKYSPQLLSALEKVTGDAKHEFSAMSTLDVLWVLYDRVLRVDATSVDAPDRDRFVLSKGHGPAAYYAVLAAKGFIPMEWLGEMGTWNSRLGYHPDGTLVPGVEIGSGSLGHGLGLAVGMALGLRAQGFTDSRVLVLLGDAELDEGANHEAIEFAAAAQLDALTAIVIDNQSSTYGWPGGIARRFHGWAAARVDGRDHAAIEAALLARPQKPNVIIARISPR
jgi:transketolase